MKEYVKLRPYYNTRVLCPRGRMKEIPEEERFFDEESFRLGTPEWSGRESFVFEKDGMGRDGIVCEGQTIKTGGRNCLRIAIAGFCIFGYFKEDFILKFSDGSGEKFRVCFSDVRYPMDVIIKPTMDMETKDRLTSTNIFGEKTAEGSKRYIYYSEKEIENKERILEEIVFPDNILMYVLGVTIDDK